MVSLWLAVALAGPPDDSVGALVGSVDLLTAAAACDRRGVDAALAVGADLAYEERRRPPHSGGFLRSLFPPKRRWTSPLHEATRCALKGSPAVLRRLLEAGARADHATEDQAPPLHKALAAAGGGDRDAIEAVGLLLHHGAQPMAIYRGRTALGALYDSEGARSAEQVAAEALLADAGVPAGEWLCAAAAAGDQRAVGAHLEAATDLPGMLSLDCQGGSPLVAAARAREGGTLTLLADAGAPVGEASRRLVGGRWVTPLHLAVAEGWTAGVEVLLAAGAPVDLLSGPSWATPEPPLAVGLQLREPEQRQAMVSVLVEAGASREVWVPPSDQGSGTWRTVFTPGSELPDLRGERPLNAEEAAAAFVAERVTERNAGSLAGPWRRALEQWPPPALAALWWQAGDDVPVEVADLSADRCGDMPSPRELRALHGRPSRDGGRWAQRWAWAEAEALVVRDRRPGRWTVLRATGTATRPCAALVGHSRAHALLRLGPPDGTAVDRLRFAPDRGDTSVEVMLEDDRVVSWAWVQGAGPGR